MYMTGKDGYPAYFGKSEYVHNRKEETIVNFIDRDEFSAPLPMNKEIS
jgi:hypothetical protein